MMKICINPKYSNAGTHIRRLPEVFDREGKTIYESRNTVKSFPADNGDEWIVKRYKKFNIFQQIAYTLWCSSKAEKAYHYAHKLRGMGIDTPDAIAYIEIKRYGLLKHCYFISTACYAPATSSVLINDSCFDRRTASALAAFFVEMHKKGFLHGDVNLSNILFSEDTGGKIRFTVIDTNRSTFATNPTRRKCLDNLKRVTHHRGMLSYIVGEYARLRGWEVQDSINYTLLRLKQFERKISRKRRIKSLFGKLRGMQISIIA